MLCILIKTFRKCRIFYSRFVQRIGSRATYNSCHLQLRVSQEIPPGECPATRIPQTVPLVTSRRLIRAVRNEDVPLFERAKISFPVSLFIPAVGDQCPGMFSDTRSIFRCLSRATGLSLSLSLFLSRQLQGCGLFSLSLLLLLNHLHRRRRFIIASAIAMRHCHQTRLEKSVTIYSALLINSAINYALEKRPIDLAADASTSLGNGSPCCGRLGYFLTSTDL